MKTILKFPAIVLGLFLLLTGTTTQKVLAQDYYDQGVSLQTFYDELSPYGTWIHDPQYGYVWRPDVDQEDFRPYYSNGHWVMTEYGNTWVSDYDWGWAPFHYGRWVYSRYGQWLWIPDTTWGPAWVTWRSGGGYYGWAPLGPSININISFGRRYIIPEFCWSFVPQRNIYYRSFPRYYPSRNVTIINRTTIINNTYVNGRQTYYTGPRADDIRRATNQNVRVYDINRVSRPGASRVSGNSVNIYAPRPDRSGNYDRSSQRDAANGRSQWDNGNRNSSGRPQRGNNGDLNTSGRDVQRDNGRQSDDNIRPWRGNPGNGNSNTDRRANSQPENGNQDVYIRHGDRSNNDGGSVRQEGTYTPREQQQPRQEANRPQRTEQQRQPEQPAPQRTEHVQQAPPQRMERQERRSDEGRSKQGGEGRSEGGGRPQRSGRGE